MNDIFDDALHAALDHLADGMEYLTAPDDIDPATGARIPRRYIGCSALGCKRVFPVSARCVSAICAECAAPCESQDCGLMRYQHYFENGSGHVERGPCEPRMEMDVPSLPVRA